MSVIPLSPIDLCARRTTHAHAILLALRLLRLLRLSEVEVRWARVEARGIEVEEFGVGQEVQTFIVKFEVVLCGGILLRRDGVEVCQVLRHIRRPASCEVGHGDGVVGYLQQWWYSRAETVCIALVVNAGAGAK